MTEPAPSPAPTPASDPAPAPAPGPTPAATPPAGATIAAGAVAAAAQVPADWPADWRAKFAGDDADALKRLERFQSPADIFKSYRELERKLSSGELRAPVKPPAADAKPEEIAAWRKSQGLPESADAFIKGLELPGGVVLGEADAELLEGFAKTALEHHWSAEQFNQAVAWYYAQQDAAAAKQVERDEAAKQTALIELGREWGPQQFQANLNAMQNLLALFPEGVADNLLGGRMADGSRIGDHPGVLRALVHIATELNPAATLLPAGGDLSGKGLSERMAEIHKLMSNPRSDYWKGPRAAGLQQEYRDLVDAQTKLAVRKAG